MRYSYCGGRFHPQSDAYRSFLPRDLSAPGVPAESRCRFRRRPPGLAPACWHSPRVEQSQCRVRRRHDPETCARRFPFHVPEMDIESGLQVQSNPEGRADARMGRSGRGDLPLEAQRSVPLKKFRLRSVPDPVDCQEAPAAGSGC